MSEALKLRLDEAAGKVADAMGDWERASKRCEILTVVLADSLLIYDYDDVSLEEYRKAREAEKAARAAWDEAQNAATEAVHAWRESKKPSPVAAGEGDETKSE